MGSDIITYCSASHPPHSVPVRSTIFKSFGRIDADGSRYLLSDHQVCVCVCVCVHVCVCMPLLCVSSFASIIFCVTSWYVADAFHEAMSQQISDLV